MVREDKDIRIGVGDGTFYLYFKVRTVNGKD